MRYEGARTLDDPLDTVKRVLKTKQPICGLQASLDIFSKSIRKRLVPQTKNSR